MRIIMKLSLITTYIIIALLACDTTEPRKIEENIFLQELDVSVTEAYLHISFESEKTRELSLFRNGERVTDFICTQKDTIITDTALTQSTNYKYEIKEYENSSVISESNTINLTTLEPTSHNFTWEIHTFGDYQSFLYDVALVENADGSYQIWAVGEVYLEDENGNFDSEPYGLVKWDGKKWSIKKVKFRRSLNQSKNYGPLNTIFSFGENNIYLCSPANLLKWNGETFEDKAFFMQELGFSGQVSCMWATDENNIYLGSGRDGTLYHYYGEGWKKLDAGSINGGITDIFGYQSPIDNKWNIFATVTFANFESDRKILTIDENNTISECPWNKEKRITSIWTNVGLPIYASGSGINIWKGKEWKKIEGLPSKYSLEVTGTKNNDIYAVGDFNLFVHYNGLTWESINETTDEEYVTIIVHKNMVVTVGWKGKHALVRIGWRN